MDSGVRNRHKVRLWHHATGDDGVSRALPEARSSIPCAVRNTPVDIGGDSHDTSAAVCHSCGSRIRTGAAHTYISDTFSFPCPPSERATGLEPATASLEG